MHGAEAIVINCNFLSTPAVAKQRLPKAYRVEPLDSKLRKERTKLEAKIMHRAKSTGTLCPLVLNVDLDKCELIQTRLDGEKLVSYLEKNSNDADAAVLQNAGVQLAKLHLAGISHGDSTTSNFMVMGGGAVAVFDFGLSQFDASLEEQAIDLLLFSKSVSQQQFKHFTKGYGKERGKKETQKLLTQVAEIQSRARYVER
ncbi:MAG: KEOPS complex kinase/ATPase Bud32 [Candidatus Micrarchaeota archaeon]|nr:KEOPS complex kinase/ATPase Bud32 [Candidatus Micrarchaeota archaeon]